jgi:hypothetical protein
VQTNHGISSDGTPLRILQGIPASQGGPRRADEPGCVLSRAIPTVFASMPHDQRLYSTATILGWSTTLPGYGRRNPRNEIPVFTASGPLRERLITPSGMLVLPLLRFAQVRNHKRKLGLALHE